MRTCSGCRSATRSKGALTMTHRRILVAGGLSLALLAAACHEDELFTTPPPPYAGGAMFQRYVAIGNSITAGFQSGGINDSTQRQSYAVLVGGVMGGDRFYYPSLNAPGCPPPFTDIFTQARVGGRSEERRVGKECRCRWAGYYYKRKHLRESMWH